METYTVKLTELVKEHDLEVLYAPPEFEQLVVTTPDLNRPGLQLAGYYDYFDPRRIQVIGRVEYTYLMTKEPGERRDSIEALLSKKVAALVLCHQIEPLEEFSEMAEKYETALLMSDQDTSRIMAHMIGTLTLGLAPRATWHGVLVEVHGEGLLILGESGIGKSETALELIKRGHRLIADDAVEIKRVSQKTLVGTAPEIIRYYMELRGIGVINARRIFGIGAVKPTERIDLVVNLEAWATEKPYDRLGIETSYMSILGVKIPCTTIPVRPGRNLAVILELAAMHNRQKKMGYNDALELAQQHDRELDMLTQEMYWSGK